MFRMWSFHRTSFDEILNNIFDSTDTYGAGFTFPTVASIATTKPEYIKQILKNNHEIASHGFKHIKYTFLSEKEQEKEFQLAADIFKKMGIKVKGFRPPYNNYNNITVKLVNTHGFEWDGGIGYQPQHRNKNHFFTTQLNGKHADFTCIPLNWKSDDVLIDRYQLNPRQISKTLSKEIGKIASIGGVIMFDLHPIRIGQKKYASVLKEILDFTAQQDGWAPTVSEGVNYWKKFSKWKGDAKFCLLLTGDIDNFVFIDYLRRLI